MSALKLSPSSAWTLKLFAECHPRGFASTSPMPTAPKGVAQPHMRQVRGLQRRGFLREACTKVPKCREQCTGHSGIFFITGKGLDAAAELGYVKKVKELI